MLPHLAKRSPLKFQMIVFPLLAMLLSSCLWQFDPYADLCLTQEPAPKDVIGVYILSKQTLTSEGADAIQDIGATIKINDDGTYVVANFPKWQEIGKYKLDKLLSDAGFWKISIVGGNSYESDWGIRFSNSQIPPACLTDDGDSSGLLFTYGDPDSGDVMIFKKTKN